MSDARRPSLRRVLRVRDLVLFYVTAVLGMRWVATAAAAGPSALLIWVLAACCLFVPLAFTVIELTSRYPDEGGIYVWARHAFGGFAGFLTGWTYWGSNLTYLPGLLYFAASTALFVFGAPAAHLQESGAYFITVALAGLALAAWLNIRGLDVGQWLANIGAFATWIPLTVLIVMGMVAWSRYGSATPINLETLKPATALRDMVFWSTIAFAFTGIEAGSFMGEEIVEPRRTIPRAVLIAGVVIAGLYILGTLAVLVALPRGEISGLAGFMDAITATGRRIGITGIAPATALLIVLSTLGGVGVWLAATARLPFVAGLDHYLPSAFGALHPRFGTPWIAILAQAIIAGICATLGQAGETPGQAYDILVSLGVVAFFLPYLTMFAAMVKLQWTPRPPGSMPIPGGKPAAVFLGSLGFVTSLAAIVLACVPPEGEDDPARYVVKVVGLSGLLVVSGIAVWLVGNRTRRSANA